MNHRAHISRELPKMPTGLRKPILSPSVETPREKRNHTIMILLAVEANHWVWSCSPEGGRSSPSAGAASTPGSTRIDLLPTRVRNGSMALL